MPGRTATERSRAGPAGSRGPGPSGANSPPGTPISFRNAPRGMRQLSRGAHHVVGGYAKIMGIATTVLGILWFRTYLHLFVTKL